MRQGQSHQNKNRSRGRGGRNSNNKGGNQSNRNMESNGPDIRIRGTAAHIAEKYTTLARDAQTASSADLVAAENYLQHAEHYNRLIAAAQAAQAAQVSSRENSRNDDTRRQPSEAENGRDGHVDARYNSRGVDSPRPDEVPAVAPAVEGEGPQPTFDDVPAEVALKQPMPNSVVDGETQEEKPAVRRRTRRAPRRPRKDVEVAEETAKPDAANDAQGELPAFIVGASDA